MLCNVRENSRAICLSPRPDPLALAAAVVAVAKTDEAEGAAAEPVRSPNPNATIGGALLLGRANGPERQRVGRAAAAVGSLALLASAAGAFSDTTTDGVDSREAAMDSGARSCRCGTPQTCGGEGGR